MNRPPEILVNSGFVTDQNGILNEIVVPSSVSTINAPQKITFLGKVLNYIPSNAATLQEFDSPNALTATGNLFNRYTSLHTLKLNSLTGLSTTENNFCYGCTNLTTLQLDNVVSILTSSDGSGTFRSCTSLVDVTLPKLQTVTTTSQSGVFYGCTSLKSLNLPSLSVCSTTWGGGLCNGCTSLTNVVLGSVGNPVTSLASFTFMNCTQAGLTITIYTTGGASLANEPWGATNAEIIYEEA